MKKHSFFYHGFIIACIFVACHPGKMAQQTTMQSTFDKEGHRGCRGLMPENTIPAMQKAIDLNVTTLEMDAVITRDNKVVVSHDPFFNHDITTRPDGTFIDSKDEKSYNIFRMDYAEVKTFDVGLKPHPRFPRQEKVKAIKPLLADLIDSVKNYVSRKNRSLPDFNIETKSLPGTDGIFHPGPAEFVELLLGVIKEKNIMEHVIIQSFDFRTLQYLHLHYPSMRTAMLIEANDKRTMEEQVQALGFTPTIYSPAHELVSPSLVGRCHQLGIKIIPWTVDDKERMQALIGMKVDGIITDYPDLFN
ncbi:MAG TPA: glycerophosphodiester phosphodiesterase [Chitinophagaceae bacterium]|nr:glycerophosphodiester phosphodiesterase [Chitinophagaceae bacterium]